MMFTTPLPANAMEVCYLPVIDDPLLKANFEEIAVYGLDYKTVLHLAVWSLCCPNSGNHVMEEIEATETLYADIIDDFDTVPVDVTDMYRYRLAIDFFDNKEHIVETLNDVHDYYVSKLKPYQDKFITGNKDVEYVSATNTRVCMHIRELPEYGI